MDEIGSIVSAFKATKDKKIFEVLYDIHYDKAFKKAYFILRDPLLCQDVVQEAFIKAFTNIGKLRDNNKFSSWLLAIVENEALISIKSNFKYIQTDIIDLVECQNGTISKDLEIPDEAVEKKMVDEMVVNIVNNLDTIHREVIIYKYYYELTDVEIASILKIREGTVKSRLHRAKAIIKRKLEIQLKDIS